MPKKPVPSMFQNHCYFYILLGIHRPLCIPFFNILTLQNIIVEKMELRLNWNENHPFIGNPINLNQNKT